MIFKLRLFIIYFCLTVFYSCGKKSNDENAPARTCPLQLSQNSIFNNRNYSKDFDLITSKFFSIQLQPIRLSKKIDNITADEVQFSERDYSLHGVFDFQSSKSVDLGMGNVPVLDQGPYGTCVTFATTAAMNVILGVGDFISQQCSLMLNLALGANYWNGAYEASQIITPLQTYGIVSKTECPYEYPDRYKSITLNEYTALADENISAKDITHKYFSNITLNDVKTALNNGHRILFGFGLLSGSDVNSIGGFSIKVNCANTVGGLWACKQPGSMVDYCSGMTAGHEAIIIGYDDSQEILKIRNSWGPEVGDHGNFYMTYKFFQAMKIDGTEIY